MASPTTDASIAVLRGAEWLLTPTEPDRILTPERLTEEQRLIAHTTLDLVGNEIVPELERLEQKDWKLARQLLRRCAELGLMSVDVGEEYGGLQVNKVT